MKRIIAALINGSTIDLPGRRLSYDGSPGIVGLGNTVVNEKSNSGNLYGRDNTNILQLDLAHPETGNIMGQYNFYSERKTRLCFQKD